MLEVERFCTCCVALLAGGGGGGLVFCALRVVDGMRLGGDAGHVDCM